jgi:23S rRNA (pseudouridine1915-N3)-methyltransferase
MNLKVISIGQLKNNPILEIQKDYESRILNLSKSVGINNLEIKELPISKKSSIKERQKEEAKIISQHINKDNLNLFLDGKGENINSVDISQIISKSSFDGKDLVFFIGGPDGFDEKIIKVANKIISFGRVTWPHKLIRIMLLEQLYRGITILNNHPYHRN